MFIMIDLLSTAGSKVATILEIVKTIGNLELILKISELQVDLAKAQSEYAKLLMENTNLKTEISNLKNSIENRGGGISIAKVVRG